MPASIRRFTPRNHHDHLHTSITTLITLAFALASATSAFAQEATQDSPQQYPSTLSRVEVRQAAAQLMQYGDATQFALSMGSMLSRAQGHADTLEALRVGAVSLRERNEFPTVAQLELIRQAGLKAVPMTLAAR